MTIWVKLRIKTDCQQFEMKEDAINEGTNNIELEPVVSPSNENQSPHLAPEQGEEADVQLLSPPLPCDDELEKGQMPEEKKKENEEGLEDMNCDKVISDKTEQDAEEEIKVNCPCGNDEGEHSGKCTDSSLVNLNTVALQATCLWRRTLLACSELNRILPTNLARHLKIEMSIAQGLVKRLEKEGFIRSTLKGKRLGKVVNKKKVHSEGFEKYFNKGGGKFESNDVDLPEVVAKDENKKRDGVENIIQQCSKMDVSGKRMQISKKKVDGKQEKLKSSKRAISLKDEAAEFDISDSQEQGFEDRPLSKRRKASIAKSAILV
ncbi:uncharacterized protein LOC110058472 [Orbicella faveolata]|uniref:uncharacterized protein LOC110058472 n=1 Tax=Orbicella faveolata TaxID=48498 RepID=UPI0009E57F6C|nr:uncharacterized protein LOC110058472 [Orbicella faveolata]